MDLLFRVDALQADAQWFGVIRVAQVEIFRTTEGYESRGKAEMAAKTTFATALATLLSPEAPVPATSAGRAPEQD